MDKTNQHKLAYLSLIRAIPDSFIGCGILQGRLKNLLTRLQKRVDKELHSLPEVQKSDEFILHNMINRFSSRIKWEGKKKHAVTVLSFVCDLIDNEKWAGPFFDIINEIVYYYERKNKRILTLCFISGRNAACVWRELNPLKS